MPVNRRARRTRCGRLQRGPCWWSKKKEARPPWTSNKRRSAKPRGGQRIKGAPCPDVEWSKEVNNEEEEESGHNGGLKTVEQKCVCVWFVILFVLISEFMIGLILGWCWCLGVWYDNDDGVMVYASSSLWFLNQMGCDEICHSPSTGSNRQKSDEVLEGI